MVERVDEYMQAMVRLGKFSGSVLLAQDGGVIHAAGYGFANRELGVSNSRLTKYRIASISKQFTAFAIMILHEQKKLSLDDPIRKHLDYSPDSWKDISIHNLLNHTAGLAASTESEYTRKMPMTVRELVETFRSKPLDFKPGTDWCYANTGYVLLGDIIQRVSGISYEDFLTEHIFNPLEMFDTGCDRYSTVLANRATGYWGKVSDKWVKSDYADMSFYFGSGSLYSTVDDLYRWEQALSTGRLLSKESHLRMITPTPLLANYGYGFLLGQQNSRRTIHHAGGLWGFRSNFVRFPDDDACIIVLSNLQTSDFYGVSNNLRSILFGEDYQVPAVEKTVDIAIDILDSYAGIYQVIPGLILKIDRKGGGLFVTSGKAQRSFKPKSENAFFREESDDALVFHKTEEGNISHVVIRQGDTDIVARFVNQHLNAQ